jgi:hypothetical protein
MADRCPLEFEEWVPEAAKCELQRLASLPEADHHLLKRLASYEVMRGEVWQKLPPAARGAEHLIIRRTHAVARFVLAWQTLEDIRKYSCFRRANKIASLATKLLAEMKQATVNANDWQELWQCLWPGDGTTFEDALSLVERLATLYRDAAARYEGVAELSANLPLRKKNAREAREIVFTRFLADSFQHDFGRPLDVVVAALASVVFDKRGEGALAPTIRGRRRSAARR